MRMASENGVRAEESGESVAKEGGGRGQVTITIKPSQQDAFTMIEVIFVIVIIGIMSAIAIPKLAATRDDARTTVVLQNLATCIMDGGSSYTARQKLSLSSASCQKALKCFDIVMGDNNESNGSLIVRSGAGVTQAFDKNKYYCQRAYSVAERNGLSAPGGKEHRFGGTKVSF